MRLNRRITSDSVNDYADHIPRDVVSLDRNEEIVIRRGIVTQSSGVTMINMVPKVIPPIDDKYNKQNILLHLPSIWTKHMHTGNTME